MKITKLLMLAGATLALAACDLPGGDEKADTTLYELKLTTNLDKARDSIRAEYRGERDADEIAELLEAGATQEDIDKAGTCVEGTYYFFGQDPVNLYEPFLPGYEFLGWYKGNEFLGFMDTDYDGNPDNIWNMDNENVTLEARFKLVNYTIQYMDDGVGPATYSQNPTTWNVEQEEVTLGHADKEDQGLSFDGWSFTMGGGAFYEGYVTKLNAQFLVDSGAAKVSSNGTGELSFALHEMYSVIEDSFKLTFDTDVVGNVYVMVKEPGSAYHDIGETHFITSGEVEATLPRGTEVKVHATPENPEFFAIGGITKDDQVISEKLSNDEYYFVIDGDAEYTIKVIPF